MRLLFLYGPAASGKLTIARELATLTGFALFHNHLVVDAVAAAFPFGSEPGLTHEKPKVDYDSGSSSFESSSALREAAVAKPMIVVAEQTQLPERSHALALRIG